MFFCGEPEIEDLMRWFSWLFREMYAHCPIPAAKLAL